MNNMVSDSITKYYNDVVDEILVNQAIDLLKELGWYYCDNNPSKEEIRIILDKDFPSYIIDKVIQIKF